MEHDRIRNHDVGAHGGAAGVHQPSGAPRLPRAAQRNHSFRTMLLLAAAAGALLAIADVLQEQRKHVSHSA